MVTCPSRPPTAGRYPSGLKAGRGHARGGRTQRDGLYGLGRFQPVRRVEGLGGAGGLVSATRCPAFTTFQSPRRRGACGSGAGGVQFNQEGRQETVNRPVVV